MFETEGKTPVTAGRISKVFGLQGQLMVSLYDTFVYDKNEPVFVEIDAIPVPLFFKLFDPRGPRKAVVVFDDFESEFRASELIGKEFFIYDNPEESENFYVGYTVLFEGADVKGEIIDFIESKMNPLFNILINGEEHLIPATDDFVVKITDKKQTITLSVPEGLLDLNTIAE